jgi:hypothetical protein
LVSSFALVRAHEVRVGVAGRNEVVTKLFSVTVKEKSTINPTELTLRIFANCGAVLSGVEERLRQIGCPKHIRDAL